MKLIFAISLFFIVTSCGPSKRANLFKSGTVQKGEFHKEVKYKTAGALIVLEVLVNGEKARFLFDTGAPNVITPELSARLNLKTVSTVRVNDSGGNREAQECVSIDSISVDGINFYEMGAIVVDLTANDALSCMNIDGIFGANAMRQAYWELDFVKQSMSFSNVLSNLSDTSDFSILKFEPKPAGTPRVKLKLNDHEVENVTFDTGSNGYLRVPKKDFPLTPTVDTVQKFSSEIGTTSYGVYGLAKSDTTFYRLVEKVELGSEVKTPGFVVNYQGNKKLLGTKVMRNYKVILDWNSNNIYMKQIASIDYSSFRNFGFGLNFKDNQIYVGSIFLDTEAESLLEIGDHVIGMNDDNFENVADGYFCDMLFDEKYFSKYGDDLKLKIKRGEDILIVDLKKERR